MTCVYSDAGVWFVYSILSKQTAAPGRDMVWTVRHRLVPQRTGLDSRPIRMRFVVEEEILGQIWRSWGRASSYISVVKPTRCTIFEFIKYRSTCFGRSFRPSSGVQDCTYSIRYMSYRLVDCLLAGTRWNEIFISCPLASSQLTSMTYTSCCVYSLELLIMDGKTVRSM